MPRKPSVKHPLREVRAATDATSQSKFAEMVGVSAATVQAVENGKLPLSKKLALRIRRATGADHRELLKGAKGKALTVFGEPYSAAFYTRWKEGCDGGDGEGAPLEHARFWANALVRAAGRAGGGPARETQLASPRRWSRSRRLRLDAELPPSCARTRRSTRPPWTWPSGRRCRRAAGASSGSPGTGGARASRGGRS